MRLFPRLVVLIAVSLHHVLASTQVTFIYPVGSNGSLSLDKSNSFSLNILAGLNGGLDGLEIGGLLNYNSASARGVQIAGIANVNDGSMEGLQVGAVANVNIGSGEGLAVSAVSNYFQDDYTGVQISGVSNINLGTLSGLSVGVLNYAHTLKGVQIGVINIVNDGSQGVPIGLISFVKNGYFALEFQSSEVLLSTLNYKMGVKAFYTIFKIGYSGLSGDAHYISGLGWGREFALSDENKIVIDFSTSHIAQNSNIFANNLYRVDLNYKHALSEHLYLFGGASLNVYDASNTITLSGMLPTQTHTFDKVTLSYWPGLNLGIALEL